MPNKVQGGQVVVDCMNGYIPRVYQAALENGAMVREPGKSGENKEKGKIQKPRLKHRPDGRKYVKSEGWTKEGLVSHPRFVNPGKSSAIKLSIEALWNTFDGSLDGVVGRFNTTPIQQYGGLEKKLNGECLFSNECEFNGKFCPCVWRAHQILTWGRGLDGGFVALPKDEIIRSPWMTMFELRDKIRSLMEDEKPGSWAIFRDKISKKYEDMYLHDGTADEKRESLEIIAVHKLIDSLRTMQRTDFSTANCYGLALHQFGIALETKYADDLSTVLVCLAVNERDPIVESRRDATKRLKPKEEKPEKKVKKKKEKEKEKKPEIKIVKEIEPELPGDREIDIAIEEQEEDQEVSSYQFDSDDDSEF